MNKQKKLLSILFSIIMMLTVNGCAKQIPNFNNDSDVVSEDTTMEYQKYDGFKLEETTNNQSDKKIDIDTTEKAFYNDDKYMYANTKINLREDYNINSNILDTIDKYEKVRLISTNDEWAFVSFNNNEGYVESNYIEDLGSTFVEVDISDQVLYLYVDDELLNKYDVVTGTKNLHDTTLGCNPIYDKTAGRYLNGPEYRVWVDRWMPFNGGEGIHDASWRTSYEKDAYEKKGSHGCVNMKFEDADEVYKNVDVGTKVLVHE